MSSGHNLAVGTAMHKEFAKMAEGATASLKAYAEAMKEVQNRMKQMEESMFAAPQSGYPTKDFSQDMGGWYFGDETFQVRPDHPLEPLVREVYNYLENAAFVKPGTVKAHGGYRTRRNNQQSPRKKLKKYPMFLVTFQTTEKMFRGVVMEEAERVCSDGRLAVDVERALQPCGRLTEYGLFFSKKRDSKDRKDAKKAKLRKRKKARKAAKKARSA